MSPASPLAGRAALLGTGTALGLLPLLLACAPERDCTTTLWFVDDGSARQVAVRGEWSGWGDQPMESVRDGTWGIRLELDPGDHAYLLVVDGVQQLDLLQPLLGHDPDSGEERSLLRVADCTQPELVVEESSASADGSLELEATFLRGADGPRLDKGTVQAVTTTGHPLEVDAAPATGRIRATARGLPPGKHTVLLSAADVEGRGSTARVPLWVEDQPWSWQDALVYQVVIDRFATAEGAVRPDGWAEDEIGSRMGGDLAGLLAQVEAGWFDALGVSALWISPLAEVAPGTWPGNDGHDYVGYHGYWPISTDRVEPAFGTSEDVHALVQAAHARGIRVILDVIPNHVHEDHPYRLDHAADGWFHEQPDCVCGNYECPWSESIETCWFTDYLPDLDWDHPDVPGTVSDDIIAWATTYDLDGFRVDAVPMMSRVAVRELVHRVQGSLEQGGVDFYLVGETFTGTDGWADIRKNLGPHGLDGQFEFPIMWALRDLVAWESGDAATLQAVIAESLDQWAGSGSVMAPFVGNHDVSRFLSEAAGDETGAPWTAPPPQPEDREPHDKLVMAQAVALTLPGAPVIYQGDELGLAGATDPDCRRPMPWGDQLSQLQQDTLDAVQRLGRARRCLPALRRGDWLALLADGPIYAHARDLGDGAPAVLVVNASPDERRVSVPVPDHLALETGRFVDVLSGDGETFAAGHPTTVYLPAWGTRLFLPEGRTCDVLD